MCVSRASLIGKGQRVNQSIRGAGQINNPAHSIIMQWLSEVWNSGSDQNVHQQLKESNIQAASET